MNYLKDKHNCNEMRVIENKNQAYLPRQLSVLLPHVYNSSSFVIAAQCFAPALIDLTNKWTFIKYSTNSGVNTTSLVPWASWP